MESRVIVPGDEIKFWSDAESKPRSRWTVTEAEETETEINLRLMNERTDDPTEYMNVVIYKRAKK